MPEPSSIGRYKVLGTLGQGAMGKVYRAVDPLLKRDLAIKVVRGGDDAEVLERFRREAEISARLNHPNVITVFDVGEEPGLGPFLAMELVEGRSLAELLKAGPFEPEAALDLLMQAADALEAAHRQGILHRDVKPANLMVTGDGRLKLMDFGIAKGEGPRLTATSVFMGTPAYASPESLTADGGSSASSDRWGLAVTAFEVITGHLPFPADGIGGVLYRVAHQPPVYPEGFSPELRAVFDRALDKDPEKRPPQLRGFLQELSAALPLGDEARASVVARLAARPFASGATTRLGKLRRSRRRWKLWAAVGGGILAAGGAMALLSARSAPQVLAIDSTPAGAEVFVDGADLGRTPLPHVVVQGGHLLRLEKPDYLPLEHKLALGEKRLSLKLQPAPFDVPVRSEPAGAEVLLDGESRGSAPTTVHVPGEGRHVLSLKLEGYPTWSATLNRHEPLPDPIRLRKTSPEQEGKVKKFFKGIFGK